MCGFFVCVCECVCRCAAHLNMLCSYAISAYDTYGSFPPSASVSVSTPPLPRQRGLLINYESLPGILPIAVLPLFYSSSSSSPTLFTSLATSTSISTTSLISPLYLSKMKEESGFYSKGRDTAREFTGDSTDKDTRATTAIHTFALSLLVPSFVEMEKRAGEGLRFLNPLFHATVAAPPSSASVTTSFATVFWWKNISVIPTATVIATSTCSLSSAPLSASSLSISASSLSASASAPPHSIPSTSLPLHEQHSSHIPKVPFEFFAPFTNSHSSSSFAVSDAD